MICKMPVYNKFASSARPKYCGKPSSVESVVPYVDTPRIEKVCLTHSCEIAVWRLTQNLPKPTFTHEEKDLLLNTFGIEVMAEMPHVFVEENAALEVNQKLNPSL